MRRMQIYREHGITRVSEEMTRKDMYTGYYEQISVGYNFRMSDIQAALGLSQLTKLEQFILRRGQLAGMYRTDLRQLPIVPQSASPAGEVSAQHLFSVRIDASRTQISRNNIIKKLRDKKIAVGVHYIPIHTQPYYKALNQKTVCLPNAELYFDETLSLPLYPKLSDLECQHVIQTLNEILN
jgi:dTDP-4-amino-4,6-dideoxygalactose transaminase